MTTSLKALLSGSGVKSIQRGVMSIWHASAPASAATATITAVVPAKTELRLLGQYWSAGSTVDVAETAGIVLTNSTTITATRKTSISGNPLYISWELTEYY